MVTKGMQTRVANLKSAAQEAEKEKQWAWEHTYEIYDERDLLVAVLARLFPSHLMWHTHHGKTSVCIHSPAGQLAWTVPEKHASLYAGLERRQNDWDHSTNKTKRERLESLCNPKR